MSAGTQVVRPGRGRRSAMPADRYEPEPVITAVAGSYRIRFEGEDGRRCSYDFARLACAPLHAELVAAFAGRIGPTGELRTKTSADGCWRAASRWLAFLAGLGRPPRRVADLRPSHFERYRLHRLESASEYTVLSELASIRNLHKHINPPTCHSQEVQEYLRRPGHSAGMARLGQRRARPGYSEHEYDALMAAARSDVAAIRTRIRRSEQLMDAFAAAPDALSEPERALAVALTEMDRSGQVPFVRAGDAGWLDLTATVELAGHLFLTAGDLLPLLVLGVGLSGRNGECVKELPAEHRVLDGGVVALSVTKRRRGKARSRETAHWETGGSESRQLHTAGGFYLLLHQLSRRSRSFARSSGAWAIWSGTSPASVLGHQDPFAHSLGRNLLMNRWAQRHGLRDDDGGALEVSMNRLRTTVEVRTAKAVGGHMPSAARTNTMDVSFRHYLRGDPTVADWAERVVTSALEDAEDSARTGIARILDPGAEQRFSTQPDQVAAVLGWDRGVIERALAGELDTVAASCLDIEHSPHDGGARCQVSFLTCLRCPNALVAERHLPQVMALVAELQTRLDAMGLEEWEPRYARLWMVITREILPKFTPAQRAQAERHRPPTLLLDLLDGPRERS